MPHRARLVRRDLAATAALFAAASTGTSPSMTSRPVAPCRSPRKGITLSDGEGPEERAPTRPIRSARWLCSAAGSGIPRRYGRSALERDVAAMIFQPTGGIPGRAGGRLL